MIFSSPTSRTLSPEASNGAASQHPLRMAAGALSPPITSTATRTEISPVGAACGRPWGGGGTPPLHPLFGFLLDMQRQLGIHIRAVITGAMRELVRTTLGTADI